MKKSAKPLNPDRRLCFYTMRIYGVSIEMGIKVEKSSNHLCMIGTMKQTRTLFLE